MKAASAKIIQRRIFAIVAIMGAILFFGYDLVDDAFFGHEYFSVHFIVELCVFVGVSIALVINTRDLFHLRTLLEQEKKLNQALSGALADSINAQLDEWRMTHSENEISWLIIKGYSFSEIALLRGVKENTTRFQATSIYTKAGVKGRAEFVAEVIQPLLLTIPEELSTLEQQQEARTKSHCKPGHIQ
ncbi:MAG: hypothetical protein OXI37_06810 [Gammaproteobacteria bacterium]|nr:hypothetical protein [Gammaproteobacteria bacterium]